MACLVRVTINRHVQIALFHGLDSYSVISPRNAIDVASRFDTYPNESPSLYSWRSHAWVATSLIELTVTPVDAAV